MGCSSLDQSVQVLMARQRRVEDDRGRVCPTCLSVQGPGSSSSLLAFGAWGSLHRECVSPSLHRFSSSFRSRHEAWAALSCQHQKRQPQKLSISTPPAEPVAGSSLCVHTTLLWLCRVSPQLPRDRVSSPSTLMMDVTMRPALASGMWAGVSQF